MTGRTRTRREFLTSLGLAGAALAGGRCARGAAGATGRPNIVFIMSDDMGYSDLGCYGGEIPTPNLDALAADGLRFTNFFNENMCVPSRATLLSGMYNTRALRGGALSPRCVTIPEALGAAGYATRMSGKWHLSSVGNAAGLPTGRGFQKFFGTILGAGSFFAPASLMRDDKPAEKEFEDKDFYYTDAISDNAVRYVEQAPKDAPVFLYVAYTAAHWPLHARPADIEKYKGKYAKGWDELRKQRYARMRKLGVIPPNAPLSPRHPNVPAWTDEPHKPWQQRRMEVYAAQVEVMDQGIGRIVDTLKRTRRWDNTLIFFTIDNGGCHVEYPPSRKGAYLPTKTRDGRPMRPGNLPEIMPGPEDTYQSYGYGWANASNTPYRLFKQHSHEGGIHLPLIVRWPGAGAKPGGVTDQVGHLIDILPTCLDAAGVEYPETFKGREIRPADGKSLVPILRGRQREGHDALFWNWAKGSAVRQGKWKLVRVKGGKKSKSNWELYDLQADPVELNDLAATMPEKVKKLDQLWQTWMKTTKAEK